jgi:hypothetical protein
VRHSTGLWPVRDRLVAPGLNHWSDRLPRSSTMSDHPKGVGHERDSLQDTVRRRRPIAAALALGAFALLAALWLSPAAWAADIAGSDAAGPVPQAAGLVDDAAEQLQLQPPTPVVPVLPPLGPVPLPPSPVPGPGHPGATPPATPTATPTPTPHAPDERRTPPVPTLLTVPPASTRRQPDGLPPANRDPLDDGGDDGGDDHEGGGTVTPTLLAANPKLLSPADGRLGPIRAPGGQPLGKVIATVTPVPAPTGAPAASPPAGREGRPSRTTLLVERANRALGDLADEVVRLIEWIVVLK